MDSGPQEGLQMMSDAEKRELQAFIQKSQGQLTINELVGQLAQTCFEKCIQNPVTRGRLDRDQESCTASCVARWFDSQSAVAKAVGNQKRDSI